MKKRLKRKLDPKLVKRLTEQITPSRPAKPKISPQFRARFLAYCASHDLKTFAATIYMAAQHGDKLFFDYLAKFLKKKPIRLPIPEEQRKLLQVYFQKPHLSAEKALEELGYKSWERDTLWYGVTKQRALDRSNLMLRVWREGYHQGTASWWSLRDSKA